MCRGTVDDGSLLHRPQLGGGGRRRLVVRAFYLRMSSTSCSSAAPEELTLVYHPAIGGAALEVAGRALPPASAVHVPLLRVRGAHGGADATAYASADRVSAAEGARFAVLAPGKELIAEGVFLRRAEGGGWRVECRRVLSSRARVAEVVVLAEGGVLVRARAKASIGCLTRLEGIPEEEACGCGACGEEEWEVVGDDDGSDSGDDECWKAREEAAEMETVRWALEMGAWAVCVGVGLLATARRFSRKRALR